MAQSVRDYVDVAGGVDLDLLTDPERFNQTTDTDRLGVVGELQGLSLIARTQIALPLGHTDIVAFDAALQDEQWELQDRLDYYSLYSNRTQEFTIRDGAWFSLEAVEAFCGESGANVATNAIDDDIGTFWRHTVNERHSITMRLRGYPKRFRNIRFRYGIAESDNEKLTNLDIRVSRDLSNIDEPSNLRESGVNITWPTPGNVWVEHLLPSAIQQARYVKLEFDTADPGNIGQIREFEVFVVTRAP